MSRRVPEAALAVGVLLSATFVAFVLLVQGAAVLSGTEPLSTLAVSVALLYPFAVWAVYHSEDPTWALPPRTVAVAAAVLAVAALAVGAVRSAPLFGVSVALVTLLPPLAYWLTAGSPPVAPQRLLAAGGAGAVGIVGLGVAVEGPLVAAIDALALFLLAAAYYVRADGRPLSPGATLGSGALGVAVVVALAVALGASTYATLAGVTTVALGAVLVTYVTRLR